MSEYDITVNMRTMMTIYWQKCVCPRRVETEKMKPM